METKAERDRHLRSHGESNLGAVNAVSPPFKEASFRSLEARLETVVLSAKAERAAPELADGGNDGLPGHNVGR